MLTIAKSNDIAASAALIAEVLRQPGAVALVPTETVYGLICRANDCAAVSEIVRLKHRAAGKFFGWFVRDCDVAKKFGLIFSDTAENLAEEYFPGAVTLILPTINGTTQAVRIPDHPLIKALLEYFDEPLVQTSANASGMPDALSLEQALVQLDGEPNVACDGGILPSDASGSTVVNVAENPPKILRQGKVVVKL